MPAIVRLPSHVISLIAAGEVVERPASAVKELVENAIDAGARSILVEVEDGGRKRIAVTDDGCGMDAEDAARALERYTTSKISREDDLWNITTLGFRGEAIHAIASVSHIVIQTRMEGALEGTHVSASGGERPRVDVAGCPRGTRVEVRDIFFNTPARRKFLKSAAVEFGHINAELTRIALVQPAIAFELVHNGKRVWAHHAVRDGRERMSLIAEGDELGLLTAVDEEGYGLRVRGWVGAEEITRASPRSLYVFVNGRPVKDRLLIHGVTAAYGTALERGRFPVAAVFLEINPANVDVNVHPAKREVRFENGPAVHDFVQAAVQKAIGASRRERAFGGVFEHPRGGRMDSSGVDWVATIDPDHLRGVPSGHPRGGEQRSTIDDQRTSVRVLGQFDKTFVICEDSQGALLMIDQHAAHERLGFEELMRQHRRGRVERQNLLFPQTITLAPAQMTAWEEAKEVLERAGFDLKHFGGNEVVVSAVPAVLGDADLASLFEKLFDELSTVGSAAALDERIECIFSVVACHRQIRSGDVLSPEELQRLVDEVMREKIDSCPHGRPAVVRFKRDEIDTWFKR